MYANYWSTHQTLEQNTRCNCFSIGQSTSKHFKSLYHSSTHRATKLCSSKQWFSNEINSNFAKTNCLIPKHIHFVLSAESKSEPLQLLVRSNTKKEPREFPKYSCLFHANTSQSTNVFRGVKDHRCGVECRFQRPICVIRFAQRNYRTLHWLITKTSGNINEQVLVCANDEGQTIGKQTKYNAAASKAHYSKSIGHKKCVGKVKVSDAMKMRNTHDQDGNNCND